MLPTSRVNCVRALRGSRINHITFCQRLNDGFFSVKSFVFDEAATRMHLISDYRNPGLRVTNGASYSAYGRMGI
jgi:hypothetical protein